MCKQYYVSEMCTKQVSLSHTYTNTHILRWLFYQNTGHSVRVSLNTVATMNMCSRVFTDYITNSSILCPSMLIYMRHTEKNIETKLGNIRFPSNFRGIYLHGKVGYSSMCNRPSFRLHSGDTTHYLALPDLALCCNVLQQQVHDENT